jgi:ATP-dependent helicase/nuclease subunit A
LRDPVSSEIRNNDFSLSLEEEARLLYVALTRAEDRLYVSGWKTKRNSSAPTWYGKIVEACEAMTAEGGMQRQDFALDGLAGRGFVTGDVPEVDPGAGSVQTAPQKTLPPWFREPAPEEAQPAKPLAPSRPNPPPPAARSPLRDRSAETKRFRRGTLLHRLFQFLPGIPPERRLETAARLLADAALADDELARYVESAARVLDDPAFAAIFSSEALAEAPLTGEVGGEAVSGIVDRLLVTPAKVLVVDYKTNRVPAASAASVPEAYRRQMQTYARLLARIYPDREIQTALLWTEAPRLDIVPAPQGVN